MDKQFLHFGLFIFLFGWHGLSSCESVTTQSNFGTGQKSTLKRLPYLKTKHHTSCAIVSMGQILAFLPFSSIMLQSRAFAWALEQCFSGFSVQTDHLDICLKKILFQRVGPRLSTPIKVTAMMRMLWSTDHTSSSDVLEDPVSRLMGGTYCFPENFLLSFLLPLSSGSHSFTIPHLNMRVHSSSTPDHNYFLYSVSQESLNTYHKLDTTLGTRANKITPVHVALNSPKRKTLANSNSGIHCNCKNAGNENCRMPWEQIMEKSLTRLLGPRSLHFARAPPVLYKFSLVYSEEHPKAPP